MDHIQDSTVFTNKEDVRFIPPNCFIEDSNSGKTLRSITKIYPGEELYIQYPDDYWAKKYSDQILHRFTEPHCPTDYVFKEYLKDYEKVMEFPDVPTEFKITNTKYYFTSSFSLYVTLCESTDRPDNLVTIKTIDLIPQGSIIDKYYGTIHFNESENQNIVNPMQGIAVNCRFMIQPSKKNDMRLLWSIIATDSRRDKCNCELKVNDDFSISIMAIRDIKNNEELVLCDIKE